MGASDRVVLSYSKAFAVALLILLMPIGNAADFTKNIGLNAREVIVTSDEIWSVEDWNKLREKGLVPLRQLGPYAVLAWGTIGDDAGPAEWRPGLEKTYPEGETRILLEPRLPFEGVSFVLTELERFGFDIELESMPQSESAMPARIVVEWGGQSLEQVLHIPGILWVEPVLETSARNDIAAGLMTSGISDSREVWDLGLDGSGVVIAFADSGLDRDHACFRQGGNDTNITGVPGLEHRKIITLNETLDDWDTLSHQDGGHGTHIGGTLGCWFDNATSAVEGTSLSHGSRLVVQDIVNEEGWVPPDVDWLLWEALRNGAVIHSDSWGDDTVEYTARTYDFDAWSNEVPWSVAFIAPGNNRGQIMEPANARSVVAVSVTTKTEAHGIWEFSSVGETHDGRRGIHITAPGVSIVSAAADSGHESWNNGTRTSTGSSMATPAAASFTAIIQQMIEEGWIGQGNHTPSGAMLRTVIALAAEPMPGLQHERGETGAGPDNVQGWGRANLSRLINLEDPTNNDIWLWDSFAMDNWQEFVQNRTYNSTVDERPLQRIESIPWNGDGAMGPFLASGESAYWILNRSEGDLDVRLSWSPRPEPAQIDDLQLVVETSEGKFAYGDVFEEDGYSTLFEEVVELTPQNETTVGIKIPATELDGAEWVKVSVNARFVNIGNHSDMLGLNGDRIGFGIAVKGVDGIREDIVDRDGDGVEDSSDAFPDDPTESVDTDGDGVGDNSDQCAGFDDLIDIDEDGLPDGCDQIIDSDGDGVDDEDDDFPDDATETNDSDGDGVGDNSDQCAGFDDLIDIDEDGLPDGCDQIIDSDGDGVSDAEEIQCSSDPFIGSDLPMDFDEDGLCDYLDIDDDGDGVVDFLELEWGTEPTNPDSDGDGLSDGDEIFNHETEPLVEDTDGDGVNDGEEVAAGTDPLSAPVEIKEKVEEEEGVPGFLFSSTLICLTVVAIINRNKPIFG